VAGQQLPGPGTIYIKQTLNFKRPVYIGEKVTARVQVSGELIPSDLIKKKVQSIDREACRAQFYTACYNQEEKIVIEGEAVALVPKDKI
jgi:acyl dehydratase